MEGRDVDMRFRLDALRRFAVAALSGTGLKPAPAGMLTDQLLGFDAAGAAKYGARSLPAWLERIASGEVSPSVEGQITLEKPATLQLDGRNGIGPLILGRAADLAAEKAREVGAGIVRAVNITACGPAALIAAGVAMGPMIAFVLGPGPSWALAIPTELGLPAVFDTDLATEESSTRTRRPPPWLKQLAPWLVTLATPPDGWLVAALMVTAIEPLTTFHERAKTALPRTESPGYLLPGPWDERRQALRDRGVALDREAVEAFRGWADRLRLELPAPLDAE